MYGFKACTFNGKKTAGKALETVEKNGPDLLWIDDVAVVSRSKHGSIRVHSTWAQDDSDVGAGAGYGALTGALIGMLLGPGGGLIGAAAGGSIGTLFGAVADVSMKDPRLEQFAAALDRDTSAVVIVGDKGTLSEFSSAFDSYGGKVVETNLDEKDIEAIRKVLRDS